MQEDLREKIALFRYGVIAELVGQTPAPREKEKLLCAIAEKTWEIPGSRRTRIGRTTVRDWIVLYQTHGFEGLKPGPRADAGRSRAIPEEAQELLLQLRAERPGASLDSLIRTVHLSQRFAPDLKLSRSSVHRLFAAQAPPEKEASTAEPDAVAFTFPACQRSVDLGPDAWAPLAGPRTARRRQDLPLCLPRRRIAHGALCRLLPG
jgi:putative transposase